VHCLQADAPAAAGAPDVRGAAPAGTPDAREAAAAAVAPGDCRAAAECRALLLRLVDRYDKQARRAERG